MKKVYTIVLLSLFLVQTMSAQDFHISQYELAEMYLNPALAGQNLREGKDFRASSVYRSQWGSIASKAFTTAYLGYDQKFKERWGLGAFLINNQAGATGFRTFNFMVAGSYNVMAASNDKHILTTGIQLGLMNKSVNLNDYTYDQQYSSTTGEFDQSLDNGELFQNGSLYKFDAVMGLFYKYNDPGNDYRPYAGLAISHISFPGQSFTGKSAVMPMHWKFNIGTDWDINDKLMLNPGLFYMFQKGATEFIVKSHLTYKLENEEYDIRAHLGYRVKDAMLIGLGMRYKDFVASINYDYNTSYLNNYTGGNGGVEFSISYQGGFKNTPSRGLFD